MMRYDRDSMHKKNLMVWDEKLSKLKADYNEEIKRDEQRRNTSRLDWFLAPIASFSTYLYWHKKDKFNKELNFYLRDLSFLLLVNNHICDVNNKLENPGSMSDATLKILRESKDLFSKNMQFEFDLEERKFLSSIKKFMTSIESQKKSKMSLMERIYKSPSFKQTEEIILLCLYELILASVLISLLPVIEAAMASSLLFFVAYNTASLAASVYTFITVKQLLFPKKKLNDAKQEIVKEKEPVETPETLSGDQLVSQKDKQYPLDRKSLTNSIYSFFGFNRKIDTHTSPVGVMMDDAQLDISIQTSLKAC